MMELISRGSLSKILRLPGEETLSCFSQEKFVSERKTSFASRFLATAAADFLFRFLLWRVFCFDAWSLFRVALSRNLETLLSHFKSRPPPGLELVWATSAVYVKNFSCFKNVTKSVFSFGKAQIPFPCMRVYVAKHRGLECPLLVYAPRLNFNGLEWDGVAE